MPFITPEAMIAVESLPGWSGRFFHSEHMTFGRWNLAADPPTSMSIPTAGKR